MPLPLSRSLRPAAEPGGIVSSTSPSGVGTATLAPSAASHGASGRSTYTSRPTTRYRRCVLNSISRNRSPARAGRAWATQVLAFADALGDVDRQRAFLQHAAA